MKFLSAQQVLFMHDRLIAETGGESGLRDLALLESAVARPQAGFDGRDFYPETYEKAAALFDGLVHKRAFVDGNKRTGISAAILFLRINNVRLTCTQAELETFAREVARSHPPIEQLAGWLKQHTQADYPTAGQDRPG